MDQVFTEFPRMMTTITLQVIQPNSRPLEPWLRTVSFQLCQWKYVTYIVVQKYMPDIFTLNTKALKRNKRNGRVSQVVYQKRY